jgi:hypothetical protein
MEKASSPKSCGMLFKASVSGNHIVVRFRVFGNLNAQVGQCGFSDIAWNLSRPASVRVSRGLQRSRLIDPDQERRGFE